MKFSKIRDRKNIYLLAVSVIAGIAIAGCGREEIKVYRVPKEGKTATMPHGQARLRVEGDTPSNWEDKGASGMRIAQYLVKLQDGSTAEVAVMPMIGLQASKEEILAIWKQQIAGEQNAPIIEKNEPVEIGGIKGDLYDLCNASGIVSESVPARVLVAMMVKDNVHWFFRLSGSSNGVEIVKPDFKKYLQTVKILDSPAQEPAPGGTGSTGSGQANEASIQLQTPDGWTQLEPTPMALSRYQINSDKGTAVVTVTKLEGIAGGLLSNVNRWRGQVNLEPIGEEDLKKNMLQIKTGGGEGFVVDFDGKSKDGNQTRIIGIVIPQQTQTWFFKMMGEPDTVGANKDKLIKFAEGAKF